MLARQLFCFIPREVSSIVLFGTSPVRISVHIFSAICSQTYVVSTDVNQREHQNCSRLEILAHSRYSGENNKILVSAHRMGRNLYHIVLKPANSASNPKLKVTLYLTKPSSLKEEVNTTAKNIPRFVSVLILKFPISPLRKRRETEAPCLLLSI